MEDRTKEFRVGLVVFATMIITMLLILMNSEFSLSPFKKHYQLQILVDQAPGVGPGTPVRRRGVLLGRVDKVEDTDNGALITFDIDQGKQIKTNEVARIQTSLIGDAVVEFTPVGSSEGAKVAQPGGPPLHGMYNPSPFDLLANMQGDLKQTIASLGRAGDEVAKLAKQVNAVLGDRDVDRMNRLLNTIETAMENFSSVMANLDDVLGDETFKKQLKEGLAQLPGMVSDARAIMEALQTAVTSADENLKNLQGLTGPLGERGPDIVDSLESGVGNLSQLLGEAALFTKSINTSEGTVGKLIHDRALYDQATMAVQQVRRILANVDAMSRRLRPILDDVRVFTDKIARDPGRLARGIIPRNRETPIK